MEMIEKAWADKPGRKHKLGVHRILVHPRRARKGEISIHQISSAMYDYRFRSGNNVDIDAVSPFYARSPGLSLLTAHLRCSGR